MGYRTLRKFADASGLSTKTLGEIEGAKRTSYDRATLSQIERFLMWPAGTVSTVLAGASAPAMPTPSPLGALRKEIEGILPLAALSRHTKAQERQAISLGQALDVLLDPATPMDERSRKAIRDGMEALLHLGEQAMLLHAQQSGEDGLERTAYAPEFAEFLERMRKEKLREPAMREKPAERR